MHLSEFQNASIVILGFGREGQSTFRFLRRHFPEKALMIADRLSLEALSPELQKELGSDRNISLHFGENYLESLRTCDVVIKSPGIPSHLQEVVSARSRGVSVTSHTALFFALRKGRVIGVTGTKGKSTTASLITHLLRAAGRDVRLVGNIGCPALDTLAEPSSDDRLFVYELSSYQLEDLTMSPEIAVFLNIFPEHLDYHGGFDEYLMAKANITAHQQNGDFFIYNGALDTLASLAAHSKATSVPFSLIDLPDFKVISTVRSRELIFRAGNVTEMVIALDEIPLLGEFNVNNALAAVSVAKLLDISTETIASAIREFRPLPHRLENLGTFQGITFYNAPLATIPEATMAHLETLGPEVHTLLVGGHDRAIDYSPLAQFLLKRKVPVLVLFPTTGERIFEQLRKSNETLPECHFVNQMEEAVQISYRVTPPGKICLHSPAAASYGSFKNYEDRGEQFRKAVREQSVLLSADTERTTGTAAPTL